jgi:protein TonB
MRTIAIFLLLCGFASSSQQPTESNNKAPGGSGQAPSTPESSDSSALAVKSSITQGLLIRKVQPDYPKRARKAGIQGTVVLRALIGTDGKVRDLRVESGDPILAEAALKAVKKWTYKPYYLEGRPVEVDTTINVNFGLQ